MRLFAHINPLTLGFLFRPNDLGLLVEEGEVGEVHSFSVNIIASENNNDINAHIKDFL